jgi:hypothetical protein
MIRTNHTTPKFYHLIGPRYILPRTNQPATHRYISRSSHAAAIHSGQFTLMTVPTNRPETLVNNKKITLRKHPEQPTQQR